jgi:transcriptional regulator with XRE-family HTH domain
MPFGEVLRSLRTAQGIGLKRLAPDLGVTYGYLSKLENDLVRPSPELIQRVAHYFDYESDTLFRLAQKIPPDVLDILREHPEEAVSYLRERFGGADADRDAT